MSHDQMADPSKDTSLKGREEEVIVNPEVQKIETNSETTNLTGIAAKDKDSHNETEGERRFKEGMANNSDTTP